MNEHDRLHAIQPAQEPDLRFFNISSRQIEVVIKGRNKAHLKPSVRVLLAVAIELNRLPGQVYLRFDRFGVPPHVEEGPKNRQKTWYKVGRFEASEGLALWHLPPRSYMTLGDLEELAKNRETTHTLLDAMLSQIAARHVRIRFEGAVKEPDFSYEKAGLITRRSTVHISIGDYRSAIDASADKPALSRAMTCILNFDSPPPRAQRKKP